MRTKKLSHEHTYTVAIIVMILATVLCNMLAVVGHIEAEKKERLLSDVPYPVILLTQTPYDSTR